MKKITPYIIIITIVILSGSIFLLLKNANKNTDISPINSSTSTVQVFPVSTSTVSTTTFTANPNAKMKLQLKDKSSIMVNDFKSLPRVEGFGDGFFHLDAKGGNDIPEYSILYSQRDGSLTASLNSLPLSRARESLSNDILSILGITQEQACGLNIFVTVPYDVNKTLSGTNLGLSYCPGNISLQ